MFKSMHLFFTAPQATLPSVETLTEALGQRPFVDCRPEQARSLGWAAPVTGLDSPVLRFGRANENALLALQIEEKVVPAAAIKRALSQRIQAIESERGTKLDRVEQGNIKANLLLELLPKALTRLRTVRAFYLPRAGVIGVEASSAQKAEDLVTELREQLGSLPVVAWKRNNMTQLLRQLALDPGAGDDTLMVEDACDLSDPNNGKRKVRLSGISDLDARVADFLARGFSVNALKLGIKFPDQEVPAFVAMVHENLALKSMRWPELPEPEGLDSEDTHAYEQALCALRADYASDAILAFVRNVDALAQPFADAA